MEGKRDREQEVAERAEPEQREDSVSLRMVLYHFSCRKLLMANRLILTRGGFRLEKYHFRGVESRGSTAPATTNELEWSACATAERFWAQKAAKRRKMVQGAHRGLFCPEGARNFFSVEIGRTGSKLVEMAVG